MSEFLNRYGPFRKLKHRPRDISQRYRFSNVSRNRLRHQVCIIGQHDKGVFSDFLASYRTSLKTTLPVPSQREHGRRIPSAPKRAWHELHAKRLQRSSDIGLAQVWWPLLRSNFAGNHAHEHWDNPERRIDPVLNAYSCRNM